MTARVGDDMPQTREALAEHVRVLQELLVARDHRIDDLTVQLDLARESVAAEQRAQRDHAVVCRVTQRPSSRRIDDVPTGGAL